MKQDDPFDQLDKHAELIGHVVVSWNEVHWFMYVLFATFSGMPEQQARDVFFSIRSDASQRELTLAAGKFALAGRPHLWARLQDVMSAIDKLAGERNAAVHTMWGLNLWEALKSLPDTPIQMSVGPLKGSRHGSLKGDFSKQFEELRDALKQHAIELGKIYQEFCRPA
jgi:hypothetical protein